MQPINDRVIIKPFPAEEKTKGGIYPRHGQRKTATRRSDCRRAGQRRQLNDRYAGRHCSLRGVPWPRNHTRWGRVSDYERGRNFDGAMKEIIKFAREFLRDISYVCIGAIISAWFVLPTWLAVLSVAIAANIALLVAQVYKMRQK